MIVTLGQAGLEIDSSFVPDGSVGSVWAKHWRDNNFDVQFGGRKEWEHNYPDYSPRLSQTRSLHGAIPKLHCPNFGAGCAKITLEAANSPTTSIPRSSRRSCQPLSRNSLSPPTTSTRIANVSWSASARRLTHDGNAARYRVFWQVAGKFGRFGRLLVFGGFQAS